MGGRVFNPKVMNAADEEISVWKPRLTSTYNTLIDLYGKFGRLNDATKVFAEIRRGKTGEASRVKSIGLRVGSG